MGTEFRILIGAFMTLLLGAGGAALFNALGFPAAFLTGPALVVTFASLLGLPAVVPNLLRNTSFLVLGLGIGAGVTPEVLETAARWPVSFVALLITSVATIYFCALVLRRSFDFDRASAMLAAIPGLLSYVLSIGAEKNVDLVRVSMVQSLRVLLLTLLVPLAMGLFEVETQSLPRAATLMTPALLLLVGGTSVVAGFVLIRLRAPAAFFLAGMAVSTIGHLSGLTPGHLPRWMTLAAFVVVGSLIGSRFRGQTLATLGASFLAGLGSTAVAMLIAVAGAAFASWMIGLPMALLVVAFAPGALEVMIAMSVQMGVDSTFVAAHHVARLLILIAVVPLMMVRKPT